VLSPVPAGLLRDAAALSRLSAGVHGTERSLVRGGRRPGGRLRVTASLLLVVVAVWAKGGPQSVERHRARMDGGLASRKGQLRAHAGRDVGGVLVLTRRGRRACGKRGSAAMSGTDAAAGHFENAA